MAIITFTAGTKIVSADMNANFASLLAGTAGYNFDKVRVKSSAGMIVGNNSETTLTCWDQEDFDTNSLHSTGSNPERLTCVTAGKYLISLTLSFSTDTDGIRDMSIAHSGGDIVSQLSIQASDTVNHIMHCSGIYTMAVGEYVTAKAYHNAGNNLTVGAVRSNFSMTQLP